MNICIILLFAVGLFACVTTNISILYALVFGYVLFFIYAYRSGLSFHTILKLSFMGIKTVKNILITFGLIGVLTALWRAAGTIPALVCYASHIISPQAFIMLAFLLNCLVSFLTGTAFGTAATMGAICMVIANALHVNPMITGGAILSGVYFGDRCSPVSTSALLVATLTKTDIYENIKNMIKTAMIPMLLSCVMYFGLGFLMPVSEAGSIDIYGMFTSEFRIGIIPIIPALFILVLSLAKVKVKNSMLVSIIASIFICLFYQKCTALEILKFSILGFKTSNVEIMHIINGGGVVSMLKVCAIVCISSCYFGIFENTDLLSPLKKLIGITEKKFSSYTVTLLISMIANAFACNQTLGIMLTEQLCKHIEKDRKKLAIYLENSAVVIAPLVPWSIAGSVSLSSAGAPHGAMITAFFLMLLPLYSLFLFRKKDKI